MQDHNNMWQKVTNRCARAGLTVIALDHLHDLDEQIVADFGVPPPSFLTFAQLWREGLNPWQAWLDSITQSHSNIPMAAGGSPSFADFGRVFELAERAVVTVGTPLYYKSPNAWALLAQLRPTSAKQRLGYLLLHPPAWQYDIQEAEHVLSVQLPPSYVEILGISNGIGLDSAGRKELFGVGRERADWQIVQHEPWLRCLPYHEITAQWRAFHGTYASEHELDAQAGSQTFLSDESRLMPFLITNGGDYWCFDLSEPNGRGEYSVVYWDHELREVAGTYADFASWLAANLNGLVFPER